MVVSLGPSFKNNSNKRKFIWNQLCERSLCSNSNRKTSFEKVPQIGDDFQRDFQFSFSIFPWDTSGPGYLVVDIFPNRQNYNRALIWMISLPFLPESLLFYLISNFYLPECYLPLDCSPIAILCHTLLSREIAPKLLPSLAETESSGYF